jgi:hypothetical protein
MYVYNISGGVACKYILPELWQTVILLVTPTGATTTPSLLRGANTTVYIHSVLANKLSLALKVTGKVTDSDTVLVFCLMYSQSQY